MLFFYFSYAGMISAGLSETLKTHIDPSANIEGQLTITSLLLLLAYRFFSRYSPTDESTEWAAEFLKGIVTTSVALAGVFFAFLPYIVAAPHLEAFSRSWAAYVTLGVCVLLDLGLWLMRRRASPAPVGA